MLVVKKIVTFSLSAICCSTYVRDLYSELRFAAFHLFAGNAPKFSSNFFGPISLETEVPPTNGSVRKTLMGPMLLRRTVSVDRDSRLLVKV